MLPKFPCSKKKVTGILFCIVGIVFTRLNYLLQLQSAHIDLLYFSGVCIAIFGLAVFSSALTARTTEKILVCPSCFQINNSLASACKKCKLPLGQPGNI
jgi:uncharacterized membrane protein